MIPVFVEFNSIGSFPSANNSTQQQQRQDMSRYWGPLNGLTDSAVNQISIAHGFRPLAELCQMGAVSLLSLPYYF